MKALVILVEYQDVKFATDGQYFKDMLMKEGFSERGATGSAYDYFVDNSMGRFRPQFDCFGPVTLPQKRSYYGGNSGGGNDKAPEDMIIHAVKLLDDDVGFLAVRHRRRRLRRQRLRILRRQGRSIRRRRQHSMAPRMEHLLRRRQKLHRRRCTFRPLRMLQRALRHPARRHRHLRPRVLPRDGSARPLQHR